MEELGFVVFKLFVWANEDLLGRISYLCDEKKGICSDELGFIRITTFCSDEIDIWLDEWAIHLDEFGFVIM